MTILWVFRGCSSRRCPNFSRRDARAFRFAGSRDAQVVGDGDRPLRCQLPLYFIIIWLPLFLVQSRGFSIIRMTYLATLGFIAQAVSALVQGWLSDRWTRRARASPPSAAPR